MEQHQASTVSIMNSTTETVYNWTMAGFSTELMTGKADPQEEIVRVIQVIGRPPIIVLGTIGNLLTFFTMQKGSLKNTSTCFYMAILALADTGKNRANKLATYTNSNVTTLMEFKCSL